jgi:hypothetical protein
MVDSRVPSQCLTGRSRFFVSVRRAQKTVPLLSNHEKLPALMFNSSPPSAS